MLLTMKQINKERKKEIGGGVKKSICTYLAQSGIELKHLYLSSFI